MLILCTTFTQVVCLALLITFLQPLKKYINMKPDWPLTSRTIYLKLGPTMENLISVSVMLNFGNLFLKIF